MTTSMLRYVVVKEVLANGEMIIVQIALGTVSNVDEAVQWLSYTYLFIRMRANHLVYGIPHNYREVSVSIH